MKVSRPYMGRVASLATKHGKEKAVGRPLSYALGIQIVVPEGIDTDLLGTFSGEVARSGSVNEVCERKARMGMAATGLSLGLASEGSFGPHPYIPFMPVGLEIMTFIDEDRGLVVTETQLTEKTNYNRSEAGSIDEMEAWLSTVLFPSHALVVKPTGVLGDEGLAKGVVARRELAEAIKRASAISAVGTATIETDMRAHLNPTRMVSIRRLACRLARRLSVLCPACSAPGWGKSGVIKGLPCQECNTPTELPLRSIHSCCACSHREEKTCFESNASPAFCPICNP